jgi:hypothetical protein
VLEEYTTEVQRYDVRLLWAEEVNAKDIHKEIFPVYYWRFTTGSRKVAKRFADDTRDSNGGTEMAETAVTRIVCCGFRGTGTNVPMLVEDMSRNKCFFFFKFEYHMFYVLYPLHKN